MIWHDHFFPLLIQMFSVVWWNKYFHGVRRKGFSDSNRAERLSLAEVHQRAPADWVIPPSSREWQGRGLSSGRVLWCELVCAQSCMTPCDPMDCSLSGSSVHRILQARIREWVAISFSRGSSWPRGQTRVSYISCIHRQILYCCTTGVALWCQLRQWFSVLIEPAAEVSSCFHVCCLGSRGPFQQYFLRTVFVSLVVYWLVEIGGREGGCQKKK